jgi:hypothetical protein
MIRAAAIAVVVAACWSVPKSPSAGGPLPGLLWITPAQPWHLPLEPLAIAPDGASVVVGGRHGWIARMDLMTGLVTRERWIGAVTFGDLVKLRDGRWLAMGSDEGRVAAFALDPTTFEPKPIVLGAVADSRGFSVGAAVLGDGDVVIAARGLPLATYDSTTWKLKKILHPEIGWDRPQVVGNVLYASRSSFVYRFDLATGKYDEIGTSSFVMASAGPIAARANERDKYFIALWQGDNRELIPSTVSATFAIDPAGKRLAIIELGVLRIVELPGKRVVSQFELGPSGRLSSLLKFDGDHLIVATSTVVRRIDLAAKTISPGGTPPVGALTQLGVRSDGAVLAHGAQLWRLVDGKVTATAPIDGPALEATPGELVRYATLDHTDFDRARLVLRSVDSRAATRTWQLAQPAYLGWLASDGRIALYGLVGGQEPSRILRTDGDHLLPIVSINDEANVRDIDLDAGLALVSLRGTVHVLRLADVKMLPATLRIPRCQMWGGAALERGGDRAVTYYGGDAIAWNRTTGEVLGSLHVDSIDQISFVPGHDELVVIVGETNLMLWSPRAKEQRSLALQAEHVAAVSPDGRRVALGFASGRVALLDLAVLHDELPVAAATPARVPVACGKGDPLSLDKDTATPLLPDTWESD